MSNWMLRSTAEPSSLLAARGPRILFVIAGRQLITAENLEVLALATTDSFPERMPMKETVRAVADVGGIPVIPWGVGKWFGRRGAVVKRLLQEEDYPALFLGDSGNRPTFWPTPSNLKRARENSIRVLPGTDPLPFASESTRVGSFGFAVRGQLNKEYPAEGIKIILSDPQAELCTYGSLEGPWRFVCNQMRMQLRKRRRKGR
jgi:hypothetical protein